MWVTMMMVMMVRVMMACTLTMLLTVEYRCVNTNKYIYLYAK